MQRALQSSSSAASYAEEALQHSTTAGQHKDTASAKAQEAAEDALAADASARASAESSEKALQYRDEAQALAAAATLAEEAATGALGMVATHLSATQDAAGQAAEDRALAESAKADALSASASSNSAAQQAQQAREQSQAIYEGLIAVNTFMVGHAYNYGVTLDGNQVSICWTDPSDFVTQELATIARWDRTRLLYKEGGFPMDENDGVVLVDSTVRDQYRETPFVHDFGSGGNYYFALFTCTTGGVWNTASTAPRFTTDDLTWATIAMMARAGTLLQYPGMAIGSVVDIPTLATFPKMRWKLAHIDYKGNYATVNDYMYDNTRSHNAIFISNYLPCWGADNNSAWMTEFDHTETLYGANWDTYFLAGRSYWKVVDSEYVQLTAGTDYENGASCADWETEHGTALYVKNHGDRKSKGYNSWKESTLRQRMNAVGTGWWTKQNPFDSGLGLGTQGLATDADSWFTDLIMPVYNRTARNPIGTASWGGGGGYDITLDKIWLPSIKEVFGTNNNNIAEGAQFDYFLNVATTAAQRIQRDEGGTARNVWLRSPNTGSHVSGAYLISTSGASNLNYFASSSYALLPAMCIA